jgi:hypothetical protein
MGCGSHAKPLLLTLERQGAVAEAWLDHSGTRMALVWKSEAKLTGRVPALKAVSGEGQFDARELEGVERKEALQDFLAGHGWFRGRDVDRLSEEEAGIMAARLVKRIQAKVTLSAADAETLRVEFKDVFARRLTGTDVSDEPRGEAQVLAVLRRHLDETQVSLLEETLPHNLRPLPGEQ